jgi:hypothetical protein
MNVETHLVYYVDNVLGILSRKTFDHFNFIIVREDRRYQRDPLPCGKRIADQTFPGWRATTHVGAVKLTNG